MQIPKRIRRTFSTLEKQACVEQWRASGLKIADFAKAQGIGPGNLQRWAGLNEVLAPPPTPRPVSFVPVEVISTAARPKRRPKQGSPGVVARIATGSWQVEIFADCRPETLKCLLKVLREVAP